ncbi:MAG: hypothetical protein EBR92_09765, partial [Alphaproteobacteria bacterium]|nr:hypothetical protein [Alphaproteobacteria bacterium]
MEKQGDKKKTLSLGGGKLTLGGAPSAAPGDGAPQAGRSGLGRASSRSSVQVEVVRKRQIGARPAPSRTAAPEPVQEPVVEVA